MKHVVFLLIVANVVYFGWNLFVPGAGLDGRQAIAPVPEGVRPLVLLREAEEQGAALDGAAINQLTLAQPPAAIQAETCKAIGPFTVREQLDAAMTELTALGLQPAEHATQSRIENGDWVYLPPVTREHSSEIAAQLKAHGDEDFFIGKDFVIAVGTYKVIERAEQRRDEIARYGLEAVIEQRFRTLDTWWLELPDRPDNAAGLAGLLAERPQLELHTLSCR